MKSEKPVSSGQNSADADTFMVILGTIGDTTWRMFVPSVGFALIGLWLDSVFGTKPWIMAAGIIVGGFFAVMLVRLQLSRLKTSKETKK